MKKTGVTLITLLAIAMLSTGVASAETTSNEATTVCPADAKVCPNGVSVGRTGPNCEFVCEGNATIPPVPKPIPMPIKYAPGTTDANEGRAYPGGTPCFDEATGTNRCKEVRKDINMVRKDIRGDIKDNRAEMEARAKEMRGEAEKKREEMKNEAQKKRIEIAHKKTELVNKRLEAAIERVQKLSDRVSEKLNKLEAEGVNVSVSRGHITEAKIKLDEARAKAAAVKLEAETVFANTTASSTPKDAFGKVQEMVKDTVKIIEDAHKYVAQAIAAIKPGINKPHPATTTPAASTGATTQ